MSYGCFSWNETSATKYRTMFPNKLELQFYRCTEILIFILVFKLCNSFEIQYYLCFSVSTFLGTWSLDCWSNFFPSPSVKSILFSGNGMRAWYIVLPLGFFFFLKKLTKIWWQCMLNNLAVTEKRSRSRYMVVVPLDLPFFSVLSMNQLQLAPWYVFPHVFTLLCSPVVAFQINFRCKPSFRESSSRNFREVRLQFSCLDDSGKEHCHCFWNIFLWVEQVIRLIWSSVFIFSPL